jgi:hypothetical protein
MRDKAMRILKQDEKFLFPAKKSKSKSDDEQEFEINDLL